MKEHGCSPKVSGTAWAQLEQSCSPGSGNHTEQEMQDIVGRMLAGLRHSPLQRKMVTSITIAEFFGVGHNSRWAVLRRKDGVFTRKPYQQNRHKLVLCWMWHGYQWGASQRLGGTSEQRVQFLFSPSGPGPPWAQSRWSKGQEALQTGCWPPCSWLGQSAQVRWSHRFPSLHFFCAAEAVVESVFTYSSVCCVGTCCVGGLK